MTEISLDSRTMKMEWYIRTGLKYYIYFITLIVKK